MFHDILVENMAIMRCQCLRSFKIRVSLIRLRGITVITIFHIPAKTSTRTFWRRKKQILLYHPTNSKIKNLVSMTCCYRWSVQFLQVHIDLWLGPLKEITSTKTYSSSSDSVPIWQQEIGKLLESEILNNSAQFRITFYYGFF
jgi:hypothetical protein